MTDREKLIELLKEGECSALDLVDCSYCKYDGEDDCSHQLHADVLLANGVVVREKSEWQYTDDIDEDGNIQAYCSACGAGDKHATNMVGKVPYCWKCGADMRKEKSDGTAQV